MENKEHTPIEIYTFKDLEKILGVSRRTLQTYVTTGKLKAVKIGNRWTVTRANLDKFVNGE